MFELNKHSIDIIERNLGLEKEVIEALSANEISFVLRHKNSIDVEIDKGKPIFTFKNKLLIGDYLLTMKDFKNIGSLVIGKFVIDENSLYDFLLKKDYKPKIDHSFYPNHNC